MVGASSLFEAAARALKAFRESPFTDEARPGPAARLTVTVRSVEARHERQGIAASRLAGQHREVAARAGIEA